MSSSGMSPANAQGRALLQMLCKFILPIIQTAAGKTTSDVEKTAFGVEADELVIELEKFISGMISRAESRNQDITIEATMEKDANDYLEDKKAVIERNPNDDRNAGHVATDQRIEYRVVPRPPPYNYNEGELQNKLQILRRYVTQKMPIRLLYFEPHNSKLKISLLERTGIYSHLAHKFQADFYKEPIFLVGLWIATHAGYSILSHTWTQTPGELTYGDWQKGLMGAEHPKCQKLINFGNAAWKDYGLTLGWIDTVCINKESSTELDESIRSMYAWYSNAAVCITYLAGTKEVSEMCKDLWFTRGWTLQELVAPSRIKFYNRDWNQFSSGSNDKDDVSIQEEITSATTITQQELQTNIQETPISRRMQLAAKRQVTREEDGAYCLMGIFDASISTAYGEGVERAFFRLVEEIFRSTKDVSDIFNWAGGRESCSREPTTSLFPSRPSDYLSRLPNAQWRPWRPIEPLTLTHLGLRTPILLMPAIPIDETVSDYRPIGNYRASVSIATCDNYINGTRIFLPRKYHLLDKRVSEPEGVHNLQLWGKEIMKITLSFGTLNVEELEGSIRIPKSCLAVLIYRPDDKEISADYRKAYTQTPIVFDLKAFGNSSDDDEYEHHYEIERNQLERHGMKLVTLFL